MNNYHRLVVIFFLAITVSMARVEAATINIYEDGSGDFPTIQAAIDDPGTNNGDIIIVHNGTYKENINFKDKAITVHTTEGATIDGGNSGNVVTFNSGEGSNSVLDGFTIKNGYVSRGGGIYCTSSSSPLITNCIIFSNVATIDGGGFYLTSSSPTIQNCIIKDNVVNYSGGGLCILWSSPTIANSTIKNNVGSGITCGRGSHSYIVNCLIKNNTYSPNTDSGGGLGCGGGNPLVVNSTITSNLAITYGGGIYLQDSCSATVINSIVWGNKNESGGTYSTEIFIRDGNGSIDITHSDIQGGYDGEGNIDSNPLFVGDGNYQLQSDSPSIDAANSDSPAPLTDIDGNPRYDDPYTKDTGAGAITFYDMGAYEYQGNGTATITLTGGWNLISLNFQPTDTAIEAVLGTVSTSCNSAWAFDSGWKAYYPAYPGYSDLQTMQAGWGYWLNMNEPATLSVSGTTPSEPISLNEGWNLVGYNSSTTLPIADALQTITPNGESVWQFKDGTWKAYYPAYPEYSDLEFMEPNYGYWIKTSPDYVPSWGEVKEEPFNIYPSINAENPVLTAEDITDVKAEFVADPFLFYENGLWYMFFEVLKVISEDEKRGEIGLATSVDGLNWDYQQIIFSDENCHLSFPYVFKYAGNYYMIPETSCYDQIRLYKSTVFPNKWEYHKTLVDGTKYEPTRHFVDVSVFNYDSKWWMFAGEYDVKIDKTKNTYLYYSDTLINSNWVEHPKNPIVIEDPSKARGAGRTIVFGNRIIRLAQKGDEKYGEKVRAFEIDNLTTTEYIEHEIDESPILEPNSGWNGYATHHVDPWWNGREWLCAVDGQTSTGIWSIGIYNTPISQTEWRLVYVDSEETSWEDNKAVNAFDGNINTIWHTPWSGTPSVPHEIQIDLGKLYDIESFFYLPRQDTLDNGNTAVNGRIGEYNFYVSKNTSEWGQAVASGTFDNNALEKTVSFAPKTGQYIRFEAITEVNGKPWTSMAEIRVMGNVSP